MSIIIYIRNFILFLILFSFQSCFLIKIPVSVQLQPIKDTVTVYHFIVPSNKKAVDSTASHSYVLESKKAYDWITKEAALFGQKLVFKEVWASNKNTNLKNTFIYKVPSKSLYVLTRKNFNILIQKKSKKEKEIINRLNWK